MLASAVVNRWEGFRFTVLRVLSYSSRKVSNSIPVRYLYTSSSCNTTPLLPIVGPIR